MSDDVALPPTPSPFACPFCEAPWDSGNDHDRGCPYVCMERLRSALEHQVYRNHDLSPLACDGCAAAYRLLTPEKPHE